MRHATTKRSQGQIEAAVCDAVTRLHRDLTGRGPDRIHASLDGDVLLVRLEGILTCVESRLLDTGSDASRGVDLVRSMREGIITQARNRLIEALSTIVGRPVHGLFHDVAPATDEEVFVVTFPGSAAACPRRG